MLISPNSYPVVKATKAHLYFDSLDYPRIAAAAAFVFISSLCIFPFLYGSISATSGFLAGSSATFAIGFLPLAYFAMRHILFRRKVETLLLRSKDEWWKENFNALEKYENGTKFKNEETVWVYFVKEGKQKSLIFCTTPNILAKHDALFISKGFECKG